MKRALVVAVLALVACSKESDPGSFQGGSNTDPDAGPAYDGAPLPFECPSTTPGACGDWPPASWGAACTQCMQAECCGCTAACTNHASCMDLNDCMGGCAIGDTPCEDACVAGREDALDAWTTMLTCSADRCNDPCYGSIPPDCGGWEYSKPDCIGACVVDHCCDAGKGCANDSECDTLYGCMYDCNTDQTCATGCYDQYPNSVTAYETFVTCVNDAHCADCQ